MREEVVRKAAEFVFSVCQEQARFRFLWHAGEPLMAGQEFYENSFRIIQEMAPKGALIDHSIQTNGTLLTEKWCDLFSRFGVRIGLSVDGPQDLHDAKRKNWSGRPSHWQVMRGYRLLRKHGIAVGGLCVLTAESLMRPDDIYDFFEAEKFEAVAFNVEESEGSNLRSSLDSATVYVESAYRSFVQRLWRRWRADNSRMHIREFEQEVQVFQEIRANQKFVREPDEVVPLGIVTIQKDGGISTFAPELASTKSKEYNNFIVGNVLTDRLESIVASDQFSRLSSDVAQGQAACAKTCAYFAICGGGFQSNRYAEHGSIVTTETTTCRIHRQVLADTILDELQIEMKQMEMKHEDEMNSDLTTQPH